MLTAAVIEGSSSVLAGSIQGWDLSQLWTMWITWEELPFLAPERGPCLALYFQQHLCVVGEFFEEEEEAFHGLQGAMSGEAATDEVDLVEQMFGEEQFLAASA